ncbi:MAG: tetratricopeptide repeat protein [Elusimicrobiales bacterium]
MNYIHQPSFASQEMQRVEKFLPFALAGICVLAFLPVLSNNFLNWDDPVYLTNNPVIRSLSLQNICGIFTEFHAGLYKPLVLLSFALEYHFFGLNPIVYHSVNLIFHIANALLVYWLMVLLTEKRFLAFAAALLFAVHPLRVESVAWIAERKDMLAAFFALLALHSHLALRRCGNYGYMVLSFGLLVLSMLSNAKAVMLPFIMIGMDVYTGAATLRKSVRDCLPSFIVVAFFAGLNYFALRTTDTLAAPSKIISANMPFVAAYGFLIYVGKTLLPLSLRALYPNPKGYPETLPICYLLAPVAVVVIVWLFLKFTREDRMARFGGAFFVIYLFPFLQWLPVQPGVAMEHLTYFPSIGLSLAVARFFERIINRRVAIAVFAIVIIILCALTWQRTKIWKDNYVFWTEWLSKDTDSNVAYSNRGLAYYRDGDMDSAISDYTKALELVPRASDYEARGCAYIKVKQFKLAISDFTEAIRFKPDFDEAYSNRAIAYGNISCHEEAFADSSKALEINPSNATARIVKTVAESKLKKL